ncbi:hypothetical protein J3E72DRAFT_339359 [Bipolaris maydis]|uniref:uncharacterized protein n=1 Tax=Cochliobolus heterostrophus TaxID=5016 RepID=UPI0024DB9504|nr:hypothetical protein J3E73DRAFT_332278 [Bipolaris maydis]KAJ5058448.1 hypothetical protein J3E74DRAFT_360517 [Bipolaris maydis]KAJ6195689.1 hypothetical protein J3E72DRAFT_339359 [Bipolaris maydis]KAJ6206478.1 hypothetical protein PSV09DRAFT_2334961 [Bipolaris maydis]KAJ6269183.1 hypothetical protein PSV08DRAFT_314914 [Bipolaris maydis]
MAMAAMLCRRQTNIERLASCLTAASTCTTASFLYCALALLPRGFSSRRVPSSFSLFFFFASYFYWSSRTLPSPLSTSPSLATKPPGPRRFTPMQ